MKETPSPHNTLHSFFFWNTKRKARKILHQALNAYADITKKQNTFESVDSSPAHDGSLASDIAFNISELEHALRSDNLLEIEGKSQDTHTTLLRLPKKSSLRVALEFFLALIVALFFASVIRQTWFELYEIPTGSMRPTFKEKDRVLVSKSAFGINIPFYTGHFLFSPSLVERGSIGVITGDGLDLPDVDTTYFGFFPGKRRYVKRIVAKPGDWVYFYGGDIFCLERDGKTIRRLKEDPLLKGLEYIPFIHFEGKTELIKGSRFGRQKTIEIKQMNIPIARVEYASNGSVTSFVKSMKGKDEWIPQFSEQQDLIRSTPQTVGDFWGIKNFAKAKLILPEELPYNASKLGYTDSKALLWLELYHSPTLPDTTSTEPQSKSYVPPIVTVKTWMPLYEEQCDRLMNGLYTARFVVENGVIYRYHYEGVYKDSHVTPLKPIEDGTYEFYHGKAYKISSWGKATELSEDHPIYPKSTKELLFWYNLGIDMNEDILSRSPLAPVPNRYAYFRNGDIVTMGTVLFEKDDPILRQFEENEINRQARDFSYFAFQDFGSPLKESDPSFFQAYGLKIPEGFYLLLGDNHAMSVDSRYFGVVPESNLQGSPSLIFWPTGSRWGTPLQPTACSISPYSMVILISIVGIVWVAIARGRKRREEILSMIVQNQADHKE